MPHALESLPNSKETYAATRRPLLASSCREPWTAADFFFTRTFAADKADAPGNTQFLAAPDEKMNLSPSAQKSYSAGIRLMAESKWAEALRAFDFALKQAPDNGVLHANRGTCLTQMGQLDKAIADLSAALKLKLSYRAITERSLGQAFIARGGGRITAGDLPAAVDDLNHAAEFDSTRAPALATEAYVASTMGKAEQCISLAEEAIKTDPSYADAWLNKGACLMNEGKNDLALKAMSEAIRLVPSYAPYYLNRSSVFVALKKCANARTDAATTVKLDPTLKTEAATAVDGCR